MNMEDQPEFNPIEGSDMGMNTELTNVKPHKDNKALQNDLLTANGMECSQDSIPVTTEDEEMEDDEQEARDGRENVPKENSEEASEEEPEEGFDEGRPDEEDEDEEEGKDGEGDDDSLNEPKDLSLVDYTRYESSALQDCPGADAAAYMSEVVTSRSQAGGRLRCDICGLSCVSINVLLVHKRSHTGERPFHCNQCGASFTQKGNLLRHIKLHSGEKPFKCHMCSYACRRRDALSGHLRTHSEKPFKCNHCGRSYKQRSSLEEHRERCHVYIQSKGNTEREDSTIARAQMGTERALLLDRLASNVAKRKSSMPQKFTGDNGVCLDLSFNRELIHRTDTMDPPQSSPGPDTHHQQPNLAGSDPEPSSSHRAYPISLTRSDLSPLALTNGHKLGLPHPGLGHSPQGHPGPLDPLHGDGSQIGQRLMYGIGHLLGSSPHNGLPNPQGLHMSTLEALRVIRGDGEAGVVPGAMYPCGHCRIIFLDYVMFTIHMGCHGFRDPLECNVCGHRSRDRYEFSSHIARGEHRLDTK